MTTIRTRALLLSVAVLLGACASKVPLDTPATPAAPVAPTAAPAATTPAAPAGQGAAGASGAPAPQSQVAGVDLTRGASGGAGGAAALPRERVVYFDFDSFVIRDEFRGMIDAHARVLTSQPARRMVIEGHTDDRGSREYNLALGQKRAEAVLRSLTLLGVQDSQLEAVSFGKERPAVQGSGEEAWARNRRAELKDR
jgi:peptidoglycan-associated lipoprotein